ncbi:chondroitin proteoglycan 2 [Anabrus simplex]|uniref:chondroitin proteoglycan 2 n=1 Tax=Anabrus simplex TaxID=316456 RepID=UPI0035A2CC92
MKVLCLAVVLVTLAYVRSTPVGSCPDPDPKDRTEHLPDNKDCTKFWRCDHAKPKQESCPSGLHFNPKLQVCDWPNRAGCKAGGSGGSGDGSGGNSGDNNGDDSSSSSESKESSNSPKPLSPTTTTTTTTTKKPTTTTEKPKTTSTSPKPSKECESSSSSSESGDCGDSGDSSGGSGEGDICKGATAHRWHLPHPSDKTKFYKCDLNTKKATLFQCPDKLEFNPSIQVCDWPSK